MRPKVTPSSSFFITITEAEYWFMQRTIEVYSTLIGSFSPLHLRWRWCLSMLISSARLRPLFFCSFEMQVPGQKPFLKVLIVSASITSTGNLFQAFTHLCVKLKSPLNFSLLTLYLSPLVVESPILGKWFWLSYPSWVNDSLSMIFICRCAACETWRYPIWIQWRVS